MKRLSRKELEEFKREDGTPWLVVAEALGISEYRFRKRLEEGYTPEDAADLANLTRKQRNLIKFKKAIEEGKKDD